MRDGNVFTGGGVTAGIDFALTVAAEVAGAEVAQRIQLSIEYDPAPPFSAGSPDAAPAPVRERMAERFGSRLATFRGELEQALKILSAGSRRWLKCQASRLRCDSCRLP